LAGFREKGRGSMGRLQRIRSMYSPAGVMLAVVVVALAVTGVHVLTDSAASTEQTSCGYGYTYLGQTFNVRDNLGYGYQYGYLPCPTNSGGGAGVTTTTQGPSGSSDQIGGTDREDTGVLVSEQEFPNGGAGAVVIARNNTYPDALDGTPLAVTKNAPILLNSSPTTATASVGQDRAAQASAVDSENLSEIQRVLPKGGTVYVLGGSDAISPAVDTELTGLGYNVQRLGGADRFATAVLIAQFLGNPSKILVATGYNFPDALTAGVAAAKAGAAVLLSAASSPAAATTGYLAAHPSDTVTTIGGPAATAYPSYPSVAGADRYATSVAVAQKFFSSPPAVGIASGTVFPDALTGGPFMGKLGGPMLLTDPNVLPTVVQTYLQAVKSSVAKAYIFGGSAAVSAAVVSAVNAAL
jgi:putative cell wall-binding protein